MAKLFTPRRLALAAAIALLPAVALAYPTWQDGGTYTAGTIVYYQGHDYKALITQTDYAGAGWNPVAAASLWQDLGVDQGSTPAPTPAPAPAPAPTPAPAPAPTPAATPAAAYGATQQNGGSVQFYAQNASWADLHYTVNGGPQQNVRMAVSNNLNTYSLTGLANGAVVRYFFTVGYSTGATDTAWATLTYGSSTPAPVPAPGPAPTPAPTPAPGPTPVWNKQTTFNLVNNTHGKYADNQVYWAIIGLDPSTGKFVHVAANGTLVPMSVGDNGALNKAGLPYSNYFQTLAQSKSVTIPPINSARMFLSVGSPMYLKVTADVNGNIGYAGANIENPTDPNIDVTFDFIEMAILPDVGFFGNTTRVDQFGFPVTLRLQGLDGYDQTVGETEGHDQLVNEFRAEAPAQFQVLAASPYSPYRIVAPAHANFAGGGANSGYLDGYINDVWNTYTTQTLTFTDQQGTFTGHVSGNQLLFTDGQGTYHINKPTTAEVLLGNGSLNDASGTTGGTPQYDKQLQLQAQMCAALNRHVATQPANYYNASAFYPANQPSNFYARFWHEHSINGLAYGFAYDDVGNFSSSVHTTVPKTATVTIGW